MAFVHHTDSGNDYTAAEAPAIMRAIYAYHTKSLHWSDIGYNFLIDRYGVIYEGHYGGVSRGVVGAQVLGFNTGSTGISVIGTFTGATPPSRAVTSLERLLEWKLDIHHVDPMGTGTLVCGYGEKFATGQRVKFPAIAGHRDANYTDCPGGRLYSQLPDVRRVVDRSGQPKIYGFIASEPAISPNADGVRDKVTIGFTLSQEATWAVEIRDEAGTIVRHLGGVGTEVETDVGQAGTTTVAPCPTACTPCRPTPPARQARPALRRRDVRLDTVAPKVESSGADPDPFSPNGDGQDDLTSLAYDPAEPVLARLSVVDAHGEVLRRVTGWKSVTAAAQKVPWDGRVGRRLGCRSGARGNGSAAPRGARCGRQHDRRAPQGGRGSHAQARRCVAEDDLTQRGRRARRGHALVHADAPGGRRGHRGPRRVHRQDVQAAGASGPVPARSRGTASSVAAGRPPAARMRSRSRPTELWESRRPPTRSRSTSQRLGSPHRSPCGSPIARRRRSRTRSRMRSARRSR